MTSWNRDPCRVGPFSRRATQGGATLAFVRSDPFGVALAKRILRPLMICLLLGVVAFGAAQTPPPSKSPSVTDMVRDVAKMLAKHYPSKADLQANADRIARIYSEKLKSVKQEVRWVSDEATRKASDLGLQQKLNLALELWRVRASIDLLALTDPTTLHDLTGLNVPDLADLKVKFQKAEVALASLVGFGG